MAVVPPVDRTSPPVAARAPVADQQVKVWLIGPGDGGDPDPDQGLLSVAEKARGSRMAQDGLRRQFVRRRTLLRIILAGELGLGDPAAVPIGEAPGGKPVIAGQALHFNLSTSGAWIAVALARRPVGIDIELRRTLSDPLRLAERFCHPDEASALARVPEALRSAWFLACWTRKEAVVKADGAGLRKLAAFAIGGAPLRAPAAAVALDGRPFALADLVGVPEGGVGAVALEGAALALSYQPAPPGSAGGRVY